MTGHTVWILYVFFFFFKQKTAYEMRISDWSSDVCSSDLGWPPRSDHDLLESSDHEFFAGWLSVHQRDSSVPCRRRGAAGSLREALDRKSTRLNPVTNAHLVCRLLLEKKKKIKKQIIMQKPYNDTHTYKNSIKHQMKLHK